jgi:hypothetical protein
MLLSSSPPAALTASTLTLLSLACHSSVVNVPLPTHKTDDLESSAETVLPIGLLPPYSSRPVSSLLSPIFSHQERDRRSYPYYSIGVLACQVPVPTFSPLCTGNYPIYHRTRFLSSSSFKKPFNFCSGCVTTAWAIISQKSPSVNTQIEIFANHL